MPRTCGGCSLCCKLLPVKEIGKPAGQRCRHQKFGKGCTIYARRPGSCRFWSCAWLTDKRTEAMRRPDRVHYVVDQELDFVTIDNDGEEVRKLPVAQVWLDPAFPDAHHDRGLRDYLEAIRLAAVVRTNAADGFLLVPPSVNSAGVWHEQRTQCVSGDEHSYAERARVLSEMMRP